LDLQSSQVEAPQNSLHALAASTLHVESQYESQSLHFIAGAGPTKEDGIAGAGAGAGVGTGFGLWQVAAHFSLQECEQPLAVPSRQPRHAYPEQMPVQTQVELVDLQSSQLEGRQYSLHFAAASALHGESQ
jgi:hypothetical protein